MPRLHLTTHLTRLLTYTLHALPQPLISLLPTRLRRGTTRTRALSRPYLPYPPYNKDRSSRSPSPVSNEYHHHRHHHHHKPSPKEYHHHHHHLRKRTRNSTLKMLLLTTLLLLTLLIALPAYTIYRPPHLLIRYFQHRWPDTLWHVAVPAGPGTRPTIALTIDDAPSAYTGEILQVLKANDAKATFFVIGAQIAAAAAAGPGGGQGMLENLVREGMELGNHAMSDRPSRDLSDAVLEAEVLGVQGWIERVYDRVFQDQDHGDGNGVRRHHFFRPGSGFFSERMRTLIHRLGLRIALGSVYPHDAQISWPRVNAWHILSMVRSGDIIVCHDRRGWTVPMLKRVLPELKRRGFRVVTLSELVELGEQTAARKS